MAKKLVRVKNIDNVTKNIRKIFKDVKREKKLMNDIGFFTVDRIRTDARKGFLSSGGVRHKFPGLSKLTKIIRKSIGKNAPELVDSEFFKATKSNITLTGQLLKSLKYVVTSKSVFILISGNRTKINFAGIKSKLSKTKSGGMRNTKGNRNASFGLDFAAAEKQASTNVEVYNDLASRGFGFIGLDVKGQKRVRKLVLDEFRRTIKKFFK